MGVHPAGQGLPHIKGGAKMVGGLVGGFDQRALDQRANAAQQWSGAEEVGAAQVKPSCRRSSNRFDQQRGALWACVALQPAAAAHHAALGWLTDSFVPPRLAALVRR